MQQETLTHLEFAESELVDRSLSERARGMVGSEILKIAANIRRMIADGHPVCNLTVGDFNARYFPIPRMVLDGIRDALEAGETNYPPADGVLPLRESIVEFVAARWGVRYPLESVMVASGARPILYGAYRCVLDPGEKVVYPVPSWNNNHYAWLTASEAVTVETRPDDGFMPTLDLLAPHLSDARLLCLNTPLNPTGTVIDRGELQAIVQAIVDENARRTREGRRHLFLLFDQVYGSLVYGDSRHHLPTGLVPEAAPWVITLDGVSKAFAGTGLRVGWMLADPALTARMKDFIGHVGAWAPRPEQIAVARFLRDTDAVDAYQREMNDRVQQRLVALYDGFERLKAEGYPVACISPQGAIYLSLRIDAIGRAFDGKPIDSNETLRRILLDEAGLAVVPFQAFGLAADSGWFRISVGAVSMDDIEAMFPRIRALLNRMD
jgi:aspartate aminotransferase